MLAGDHIYKMDYEKMLQQHVDSGADVTVGCLEASLEEATGFGVMHVDDKDRIIAFLEKPKNPPPMPGKPDVALVQHGHLRLRDDVPDRPAASATPPTRIRATISARTSFPTSSRTAKRSRITSRNPA